MRNEQIAGFVVMLFVSANFKMCQHSAVSVDCVFYTEFSVSERSLFFWSAPAFKVPVPTFAPAPVVIIQFCFVY